MSPQIFLCNPNHADRHKKFSQECPGSGVVGKCQSSASEHSHGAILLWEITRSNLVHPHHARRRRKHGAFAGSRGRLWRDRVFRVSANKRDWHSDGPGSTATKTHGHVRASRAAADWHRCRARAARGGRLDAAVVVTAFQRKAGGPNHLRGSFSGTDGHCLAGELSALAPRGRGGPGGSPASRVEFPHPPARPQALGTSAQHKPPIRIPHSFQIPFPRRKVSGQAAKPSWRAPVAGWRIATRKRGWGFHHGGSKDGLQ